MKVEARVTYGTSVNDRGFQVECTYATCTRCGNEEKSFGTSDASATRCLVMLNRTCLEKENNYYVAESK